MRAWMKTLVNATETKIYEGAWKISVAQKSNFEVHFLSNLVFKFNIVLTGIFWDNFHHTLFTFLPFD